MPIPKRIQALSLSIATAMEACHRQTETLRLMAVSKGQAIDAIRQTFSSGISDFGENYWQEMQTKMQALQDLPITWHFIGRIQSNKAALIAKQVDWVHGIDNEGIARLLSKHRPAFLPALNVCIQVNLDQESTKSGIKAAELSSLAHTVSAFPRLKLRGLMAIPKAYEEERAQISSFMRLTTLVKQLNKELPYPLDTLSMGTSKDYMAAIIAGSTFLRIGQAIFNPQF